MIRVALRENFKFVTFKDYLEKKGNGTKMIVLKHDVDRMPKRALMMARKENELGINSSYYFRVVKGNFTKNIIREIQSLGHEIGYHYEDLSLANGNYEQAIKMFEIHLNEMRKICPIRTIGMHGSPLSRWDNRLIWKIYDYKEYGIIGDGFLDIDSDKILYLTDTGRRWNNKKYNVRDKVISGFNIEIKTTFDFILLIEKNRLPNIIIVNTHPNRWNNNLLSWTKELLFQNLKNVVKSYFVKNY